VEEIVGQEITFWMALYIYIYIYICTSHLTRLISDYCYHIQKRSKLMDMILVASELETSCPYKQKNLICLNDFSFLCRIPFSRIGGRHGLMIPT
jgi:hypothetical protein